MTVVPLGVNKDNASETLRRLKDEEVAAVVADIKDPERKRMVAELVEAELSGSSRE